ncbi:MAG: hypothetical protein JW919_01825 [Candidatus Omnitrophica bacterium]|nr:hypothetical protein [Candidatus Omnitrophota bacterium]
MKKKDSKKTIIAFFAVAALLCCAAALPARATAGEIVLFDFEKDPEGWEIPDWALEKPDHVAQRIAISKPIAAPSGTHALEVGAIFSDEAIWQGAYVERVTDITDWSQFRYLSADIYLPKAAPRGLRARLILTVGDGWNWAEMNKTIPLNPGEWTIVKADISPGSRNWRKFLDDGFRADVRKMGVRIESNGKIAYQGPVYIDNIKLSEE